MLLGYINFCRRKFSVCSTTFTQCSPKATEFGEKTQRAGHYAVQCHSRSPILVPWILAASHVVMLRRIEWSLLLRTLHQRLPMLFSWLENPQIYPFPWGISNWSGTWFLGPCESAVPPNLPQTLHLDRFVHFAGLTNVTTDRQDTHRDNATPSVAIGRI